MVLILSPALADKQVISASERLLSSSQEAEPVEEASLVTWNEGEGEELQQGICLKILHPKVRESLMMDVTHKLHLNSSTTDAAKSHSSHLLSTQQDS